MLTDEEKDRYHRQIILPRWGERAQEVLKTARVFVAGAGGLGSPAAYYLAAAGVGTIRICDSGTVERSNLNRQILHGERDIGKNKALSASASLSLLNPLVRVVPLREEITDHNVERLVGDARIMVDCLDNIRTRLVLNGFAVRRRVPLVHAGVSGLCGQITFVHAPDTPCLSCFLPRPGEGGVFPILGATAAVLGSLEALEALKYLTGEGKMLKGTLLYADLEAMEFHRISVRPDPACPVCGRRAGHQEREECP